MKNRKQVHFRITRKTSCVFFSALLLVRQGSNLWPCGRSFIRNAIGMIAFNPHELGWMFEAVFKLPLEMPASHTGVLTFESGCFSQFQLLTNRHPGRQQGPCHPYRIEDPHWVLYSWFQLCPVLAIQGVWRSEPVDGQSVRLSAFQINKSKCIISLKAHPYFLYS